MCTKCREPFLEMAKLKIKYEQSQQKLKEIVNNIDVIEEDNSKKEGRKVPCESPNKENKMAFQKQQVCRKLQFIEKETRPAKELKAQQFQVKDVLDEILEETRSEEDMFVGILHRSQPYP